MIKLLYNNLVEMHLFEGPGGVEKGKKKKKKKPSTLLDTKPQPLDFFLPRRVLYHCATTAAQKYIELHLDVETRSCRIINVPQWRVRTVRI